MNPNLELLLIEYLNLPDSYISEDIEEYLEETLMKGYNLSSNNNYASIFDELYELINTKNFSSKDDLQEEIEKIETYLKSLLEIINDGLEKDIDKSLKKTNFNGAKKSLFFELWK